MKPARRGDGWPRQENETCSTCGERKTCTTDGRGFKVCDECTVPASFHPEMR